MKSLASHCDRLERSGLMGDDTGRWDRLERRRLIRAHLAAAVTYIALCLVSAYVMTAYLNGYTA